MKLNSKKIIAREFLILICGITLAGLVFLYTVLSNLYFKSRYDKLENSGIRTNYFLNYVSDSVLRNGYINNLLDTIGIHDFQITRTVHLFDTTRKVHLIGEPTPIAQSTPPTQQNDTGIGPVPKIVLGKPQLVDPSLKPGQPTNSGPKPKGPLKVKVIPFPDDPTQTDSGPKLRPVGPIEPFAGGEEKNTPSAQPALEPISAYNSAHHRLATAIAGDPGATSDSTPSSSIISGPFSNTPPWPYIIMAQDSDTIAVEVHADQDSIILLKNRQNQLKNLIDTLKMYNESETNIETFELEFITWYGKQTNFLLTFDQLSDSGVVFVGKPELVGYSSNDRLFHEKTDSINQSIIEKISSQLNNINDNFSKLYNSNSNFTKDQQFRISLYALIIIFIILYPIRLLYLSIRWSIRILKNRV